MRNNLASHRFFRFGPRIAGLACAAGLAFPLPASAEEAAPSSTPPPSVATTEKAPKAKSEPAPGQFIFGGHSFGDYYWMQSSHDDALTNRHGFLIRRLYLRADVGITESLSARARLELGFPGNLEEAGSMAPFAKDLYVQWKQGDQKVIVGLSPTPTWGTVEKTWGYRFVEKTLADLSKMGGSRDVGISAKGNFGANKMFQYHVMYGNGSGTKSQVDSDKKVMAAFAVKPTKNLIFEVYGDAFAWYDGPKSFTGQAFAGYVSSNVRAGAQYLYQHRGDVDGSGELALQLASAFGVVKATEELSVFARYDRNFKPNPGAEKIAYIPMASNAASNFILAGVDYNFHKSMHVVPNVEAVVYDSPVDGAETPKTDVVARLTFFWKF